LFPLFRQRHAEKLQLFRDGIHLTDAGHRLTAKAIYDFLRDKGLLPHLETLIEERKELSLEDLAHSGHGCFDCGKERDRSKT
jgi:hypothetical protein